jgi:hypothetical protein
MKTITLLIGNSDNKLTQCQWKDFCNQVHERVDIWSEEIHFSAPSVGWADWQNASWVFICKEKFIDDLKIEISEIRKRFLQNSVAWTEGNTEFV